MQEPAFGSSPPPSRTRRILVGFGALLFSLGVLFMVCYFLERFKAESMKFRQHEPPLSKPTGK